MKYDPEAAHRDPNWSGWDDLYKLQDDFHKLESDIMDETKVPKNRREALNLLGRVYHHLSKRYKEYPDQNIAHILIKRLIRQIVHEALDVGLNQNYWPEDDWQRIGCTTLDGITLKQLNRKHENQDWPPRKDNRCKQCSKDAASEHRKFNIEHYRRYELYRRHNITLEHYNELFSIQNGSCAICKESGKKLIIDHDHRCCPGRKNSCGNCIRGLICNDCNRGIGLLKDNPQILYSAADYINKNSVNLLKSTS